MTRRGTRRDSPLSSAAIARRRTDVEAAQAMNRLEGAPAMNAAELALLELWVTGKITTRQYIARCRRFR